MDLRMEVFVTGTDTSYSSSTARKASEAKAATDRAVSPNPLCAMMQSLRVPIGTDIDASNIFNARAQLEEDRQRLLDLTEMLAATQCCLDSTQLERNAAYGFMPARSRQAGSPTCDPGVAQLVAPSSPSRTSTRLP